MSPPVQALSPLLCLFQVHYQSYESDNAEMMQTVSELLQQGLGITVNATYVLKVTWYNMAPVYPSKTTEVGKNRMESGADFST